jgi:hypothetical protein
MRAPNLQSYHLACYEATPLTGLAIVKLRYSPPSGGEQITRLSDKPLGGQMPGGARDEDFDDS